MALPSTDYEYVLLAARATARATARRARRDTRRACSCAADDKSGCYAGITSLAAGLLTSDEPFDSTRLYVNLRKSSGGGTMPKTPAYTFTPEDIQRLSSWVAAGAQDD